MFSEVLIDDVKIIALFSIIYDSNSLVPDSIATKNIPLMRRAPMITASWKKKQRHVTKDL